MVSFCRKKDLLKLKKNPKKNDLKINFERLNLDKHNFDYIKNNFEGIVISNLDIVKKEEIKKLKLLQY